MLRLIQKWLKAGVTEEGEWTESKVGTPQGAVVSPLLANIYLHYAFDLWVAAWRRKVARGDMIVVRYADDAVLGFEHKEEAERFLGELRGRLGRFGLELHPEKTRLIEFGRYAAANRERRGEGKPETFDFLGFTHKCGKNGKTGNFVVRRKTVKKRMHAPIVETGVWLERIVRGYYQYHGVPGNTDRLGVYRERLLRHWRHALRRRSQRRRPNWDRLGRLFDRWLPRPCILHPFPNVRFDARHPR